MKTNLTRGQWLILLLLLAAGVALIRHTGREIAITQGNSAAGTPASVTRTTAATTDPGKPETTSGGARAPGSGPAENAGRSASDGPGTRPPLPSRSLEDLQSRNGLPRLVVNLRGRFILTGAIQFVPGKPSLRFTQDQALDRVAGLLREWPDIKLEILGHTDSYGDEGANFKLTSERAAAVVQYLIAHGVDGSRLTAKGLGSGVPIAPNNSRAGRQANRRIEFCVTSPK